jgi:hypothetical protein
MVIENLEIVNILPNLLQLFIITYIEGLSEQDCESNILVG